MVFSVVKNLLFLVLWNSDTIHTREYFLANHNQIAPKMLRWHQVFRTKTQKMDEKAKPSPKFSKNRWKCQIWIKISHMSGCKEFSIQNINKCTSVWLHHNALCCQPSIFIEMKKSTLVHTLSFNLSTLLFQSQSYQHLVFVKLIAKIKCIKKMI
jgi:ribosomal protein L32E